MYVEWGDPEDVTISGDFDITPSTINWGESFSLRPKDFKIPASCTYAYHDYMIGGSSSWYSDRVGSQSSSSSYSYSNYPYSLAIGPNLVQIRVTATCADGAIDSGWVNGKFLTIKERENNSPPQFSAGFFREYNRNGIIPDYEVPVGTKINLRIINNNTSEPAMPYDPDGDPITYTWLFESSSSAWVRSLPDEYGAWEHDEVIGNLTASELGVHSVTVIARDSFGAESRRTVSISVIPPNPIPIIEGPTEVKENRPLPAPFSGAKSYSPMGRTITQYLWENNLPKYTTVGTERIRLEVVDSAGFHSLYKTEHTLTVLPDEPPVAVVESDPLGIRVESYDIFNKSYSPDKDPLVKATYRYKYDQANDGFDNDAWVSLAGDLVKSQIKPVKVGKYLIELTVEEDYGKTDTATTVLDTTNLAPSVSFTVEGKNEVPEPPNKYLIPADRMIKNWDLYETNSMVRLINKPYMWAIAGDKLLAGLGKGMEQQFSYEMSYSYGQGQVEAHRVFPVFTDNGYGPNSISPYKALAARDPLKSSPILIPTKSQAYPSPFTTGEDYAKLEPAQFHTMVRSNNTHVIFDQKRVAGYTDNGNNIYQPVIFGMNKSRLPGYASETIINSSNPYNVTTSLIHKWIGSNPYDFIIDMYRKREYPYYTKQDMTRDPNWKVKADAGDFSTASGKSNLGYETPMFEVAGNRILAVYNTRYKPLYAYYESCCDSDGRDRYKYVYPPKNYADVYIYDATTGEFLGSSFENGERAEISNTISNGNQTRIMTKGSNIVLLSSEPTQDYIEIDRDGRFIKSGKVPLSTITVNYEQKYRNYFGQIITAPMATYSCSWGYAQYGTYWKDDAGNFYSYRNVDCYSGNSVVKFDMSLNPDIPQGVYLVQIKPDYTVGTVAKLQGTSISRGQVGMYDFMRENYPILFYNPVTKQAVTRTYTVEYCNGCMWPTNTEHSNMANMTTGVAGPSGLNPLRYYTDMGPSFYVTHSGAYGNGWVTSSASGTLDKFNFNSDKYMRKETTSYTYGDRKTKTLRLGEYVGDGIWLSIYEGIYQDSGPGFGQGGTTQDAYMFLDSGLVNNTQAYKTFQFGQFVSPEEYTDAEFNFTLSMDSPTENAKTAGFSFRMASPINRYAVETDGASISLVKYVAGARTVLQTRAIAIQKKTDYKFKVLVKGDRIEVYLGGVPYLDKRDATFTSGKFGPFSDKSYTIFDRIEAKELNVEAATWLTSYAIWDENGVEGEAKAEVRYSDIKFEDPENDAQAGDFVWGITHTPKFLNNQGLSSMNGKTFSSPTLTFDKVGNYRIGLRAKDDPNAAYPFPGMEFDEYRKDSNEYWRIVTVHRRPVSCFDLGIHSTTLNVTWNDCSYDPDRWQSSTVYDTESTGIDYKTTRGVTERKYYYITPSGNTVNGKLVTPQEVGTYTAGMQVRDDYGAWSYWTEHEIDIAVPVIPDDPPVPGFTLSTMTLKRGEALSITSTAYDKEDGAAANLTHEYYIRNVTTGSVESLQSTNRGTWAKTFNSVGNLEIRQVVCDSKGQCAQMTKKVSVLNLAPVSNFDWSPKPAYEGDAITLVNQSTDHDGDTMSFTWTVTGPNAYRATFSTTNASIPSSVTNSNPGVYTVRLRAVDSYGEPNASDAVKTIAVNVLSVAGQVTHTENWEENRQQYNNKYPGSQRAVDVFWAGEKFVLAADTTVTGTLTTATTVTVRMGTNTVSLSPTNAAKTSWTGSMWEEDYEELSAGTYTFTFTAAWSNGTVKTNTVTVRMLDDIYDYFRIHRLK
ncbi:PKD domain-containing protein [Cohnella panacarvi]|uniref:PKD domain-containing protein n=1 Tax=Cohnella panacarvi TaxID=400776 RepID=UPI0004B05138|nr:PKD domain-containing protein [Cohnella panacarvi]